MKRSAMGNHAATGIHPTHATRVFAWLWHAWVEAQHEIPLLRWLALSIVAAAGVAVYLAVQEGKTALDIAVYGGIVLLFALAISANLYLLFEIYRKHRSDAIFDSKRLAHLIQKIAQEEIEAHEQAKLAGENTLLMPPRDKDARQLG
jgi:hypothetical protein